MDMFEKMKDDYKITFIRGATTASGNTIKEIEDAVVELIDELIERNNLIKTNVLSIIFTATKDLDACFPASIARKCNGLNSVAFLDCQQMHVLNDVKFLYKNNGSSFITAKLSYKTSLFERRFKIKER
tara:strand:- start:650 stop:1033 length:384 start_codon:yes stop_codon:yes gene_type:complete